MNLLFLSSTQNKKKCEYYSSYLAVYNENCRICDNYSDFYNEICNTDFLPDILVLDYACFNHILVNVYKLFVNVYDCKIPAIFFDDPYFDDTSPVEYWQEVLEMVYDANFQFGKYKQSLKMLSNAMNTYQKQHRSIISNTSNDEEISYFCKEVAQELKSSAYGLYEELANYAPNVIPIDKLREKIKKNEKIPAKTTIICLVSEIRSAIKKANKQEFDIVKSNNGYKLIRKK